MFCFAVKWEGRCPQPADNWSLFRGLCLITALHDTTIIIRLKVWLAHVAAPSVHVRFFCHVKHNVHSWLIDDFSELIFPLEWSPTRLNSWSSPVYSFCASACLYNQRTKAAPMIIFISNWSANYFHYLLIFFLFIFSFGL